jgi:hypothetical protein
VAPQLLPIFNKGTTMMYKPILLTCAALLVGQAAPAQTNQKAKVSSMASLMLSLTDKARQAIENKDKDTALLDVKAALDLAEKIQSAIGTQTSKVPIYTELEQVSIIGPIHEAQERQRGQAGGTKSSSSAPESGQNRGPPPTTSQRVAVKEVVAEYTSVTVDVAMAKDRLKAATIALYNDKLQDADSALAAVQNGVVLESGKSDLPLLKARQNLILAKTMVEKGEDPRAPLKAASDALKEYEGIPSAPHSGEAAKLRREIESQSGSVTANKLDRWWNEVTSWVSRQ